MGKRNRADEPPNDARVPSKKSRHDTNSHHAPTEEIITARQLQNLLVFEQDQSRLLASINSFKSFLSSILHPPAGNEDDVPRRRAILTEYLDSQRPRDNIDHETEYLPNLMQSLNFAATANSDALLSTVASALDQLLKLLSASLELREHGLSLCRTLLQQAQLRVLSRGVASPKHKEHVIGPCLRILREIVTFDGGTLARQLYAKRDLAFDPGSIARCLTYRRSSDGDGTELEDVVKRPSVRTTAIRYVLANFKFQDDGAKADMLRQGNMLRNLVDGIEADHPQTIREILQSLMRDVIQDTGIPRRNKSFLLNERNLASLCQMYRSRVEDAKTAEDSDSKGAGQKPLQEIIHSFMVSACTSPDAGLLRASGWYPPTTEEEGPVLQQANNSFIDLGLDGIAWYNKFTKHIPIRNTTLSDFILTLRPYAYDSERKLLLAIFEAAPELVAWYWRKMGVNFPFTPKLTATWIGYAAAVFETVRLPVPALFARMAHIPPPVSIMIENILPTPLDQKTLRQCLVSKSDLIRLFGIRILVASFEKLRDVLSLLGQKGKENGKLWDESAEKLVEEFGRRCPTLQDIVKLFNTLRNDKEDKVMQKEATLRLLALYHEVLPQIALEENFDASIPLTNVLQAIDTDSSLSLDGDEGQDDRSESQRQMRLLELSHLVKIASWTSSVHWYTKAKGSKHSPLVTLLKLLARNPADTLNDIGTLIEGILKDSDALETTSVDGPIPTALQQLIASLRLHDHSGPLATDAVFSFLDNCFHRFSTRPIKYEDDKDELFAKAGVSQQSAAQPCSLICITFVEQLGHMKDAGERSQVGRWLACFLFLNQEAIAEVLRGDERIKGAWEGVFGDEELERNSGLIEEMKAVLEASERKAHTDLDELRKVLYHAEPHANGHMESPVPELDPALFNPSPQPDSHPILTRYRKKDISTLIEDGSLPSLITCLSSPSLSIRLQSISALRTIMTQLMFSTHLEKEMLYLLLGELLETCTDGVNNINEKAMSGIAIAFAAKSVEVLRDPTSAMYIKLNEFLNRGPGWMVRSMPGHWLGQVLLHPPADQDTEGAYWREVVWVLEWLYESLLTDSEFDILRRNSVFEKVMALFFHPSLDRNKRCFAELVVDGEMLGREVGLQAKVRPLVLRLVARAACVGGATVLVTGMGVLAWLNDVKGVVSGDGRAEGVVEGIKRLILDHADKEKVREWSGGALI